MKMETSVKLAVIDREIIKGYSNEEYATLRDRDRDGSLVMVRYRFSVDGDHFPVQVLIDTAGMRDDEIIPAARKRVREVLAAALAHVEEDWDD
ncbi:hypothetical protein [Mesorhizobium sp. CAU 1741]|uniref:hypothetical protein n=1 Tax=Mesorhizobium sp. CAU 1741 TaxID=3140366 RepID=UPI00325A513F